MTAVVVEEPSLEATLETPQSSRSSLSVSANSSASASTSTSHPTSNSTRSSILRTSNSFTLPRTTVTFAPLPPTEPRRRKSNVQLGVAARSRLLHHRRVLRDQGLQPPLQHVHSPSSEVPPPLPVWDHNVDDLPDDDDDDGEDLGPDPAEEAFAAIGKFVRGASRSLWRRMSQKDIDQKQPQSLSQSDRGRGSTKGKGRGSKTYTVQHLYSDDTKKPCQPSEEGGVWEEEVGGDSWEQLRARALSEGVENPEHSRADRAQVRTSTVEVFGKRTSTASTITASSITT